MNEISINTVENIYEIYQIILLTTCTTKLHSYYRVTLHFSDFHQKNVSEIPPTPLLFTPFYYLCESMLEVRNTLYDSLSCCFQWVISFVTISKNCVTLFNPRISPLISRYAKFKTLSKSLPYSFLPTQITYLDISCV